MEPRETDAMWTNTEVVINTGQPGRGVGNAGNGMIGVFSTRGDETPAFQGVSKTFCSLSVRRSLEESIDVIATVHGFPRFHFRR